MTGISPEQQATLDWLGSPEGEPALAALTRMREAMERERQANSPEARNTAQEAALKADAALSEVVGMAALRRRRILAELTGEEVRDRLDERDYQARIGQAIMDGTPKGRNAVRRATWRMAQDLNGIVGDKLAFHVAAHMREVASGRIGLMDAEPQQGVDTKSAPAFGLRTRIVADTGYTVGAEVDRSRVPSSFWKRAARLHNELAALMETDIVKVAPVSPKTIRDWCTRQGEWRDLFEKSRAEGRRDRAALSIDTTRLLKAK
jgi:hypothetical protein